MNFPPIFGVIVVFGVATLLHMLLSSLKRRRQETGLLKSLGFVRRQVALTVSWHTTTVAVIGIVLGVPLGIAAGRLVWTAFASNLGVVAVPVVTAWVLIVIAIGTLVVANLLSAGPALMASRAKAATLSKRRDAQRSRRIRSSKVSRRTTTRAVPPATKRTAGRGTLL